MSRDAWFPLFHRDFRGGTRKLSLEERGAYMELLMLMYDARSGVEDDEAGVAAELGCDRRVWRRIRQKLLDVGKIEIEGGRLINARARREIEIQRRVSEQRTASGAEGGRKSGERRRRKVSEIDATSAELPADFSRTSAGSSAEVSRTCDAKPLKTKTTREAIASIPQSHTQREKKEAPAPSGAAASCAAPLPTSEPERPPEPVERPPDPPRAPAVRPEHRQAVEACFAAAGPGLADPARTASLHTSAGRIVAALEAGCDLEADLLPVIRARTARGRANPIAAWGYFEAAWLDARNERLRPLPPPPDPQSATFASNVTHIASKGARHDFAEPRTYAQQQSERWRRELQRVREIYGLAEPQPELVAATLIG